ncbi:hypothetical protein DPMN_085130 [Dreissena polymorpha]|uniref:Uncharacterized protein n=1 Tax=Dreissena polymorpha TaxID=45954 RepID=A0A9D3YC72_DREPO|nr:hypothetical protein DPMN_085130 [Dreissena polymorpha]
MQKSKTVLYYFLQLCLHHKGDDNDTSANAIEFQCWDLHARLHTVPTASNINDQGDEVDMAKEKARFAERETLYNWRKAGKIMAVKQ